MAYILSSATGADTYTPGRNDGRMSLGSRIRQAREKRGVTQKDVADLFRIKPGAVGQWESNTTKPDPGKFKELAAFLGVTVDWLLDEAAVHTVSPGAVDNKNVVLPPTIASLPIDVPVYGVAVGGSVGDFQMNGAVVDYVRRPPGISSNRSAYCIYMTGSSMEPKFKQGDLIYIDPNRPARPGDYVLVELNPVHGGEPGPAYVKMLVATGPTKLRLSQHNPANDKLELQRERVRSVHRIMELNELLGV